MIQFDSDLIQKQLIPFINFQIASRFDNDKALFSIIRSYNVNPHMRGYFRKVVFNNPKDDFQEKIIDYSDLLLQSLRDYYRLFAKGKDEYFLENNSKALLQISYLFLDKVKDFEVKKIVKPKDLKDFEAGKVYVFYNEEGKLDYKTREQLKEESAGTNFRGFIGTQGGTKVSGKFWQDRDEALNEVDMQIIFRAEKTYLSQGYTIEEDFKVVGDRIIGKVKDRNGRSINVDVSTEESVSLGKSAVDTARKAVMDYQKSMDDIKKDGQVKVPKYAMKKRKQAKTETKVEKEEEPRSLLSRATSLVRPKAKTQQKGKKKKFWSRYKIAAAATSAPVVPASAYALWEVIFG